MCCAVCVYKHICGYLGVCLFSALAGAMVRAGKPSLTCVVYVCMYVYIYIYNVHVYSLVCMCCVYVYKHICGYLGVSVFSASWRHSTCRKAYLDLCHVCMYVCIYIYNVHVYSQVCMYMYVCVCMFTNLYVNILAPCLKHTCILAYMHTNTSTAVIL